MKERIKDLLAVFKGNEFPNMNYVERELESIINDEEKEYAFQYYSSTNGFFSNTECIHDITELSKEEAERLFNENIKDFKKRLQNDETPEMAIWFSRDDNTYQELIKHWHGDDCIIKGEELYLYIA